jgi:porin
MILLQAASAKGTEAWANNAPGIGITGDWSGLRTHLADQGIDLQIGYSWEGATNLSGGTKRAAAGAGQLALGTSFDLEKLLTWPGADVQLTVTRRHGADLGAAAHLGVLQQVQEVYGRGDIWRLTDLWLDQAFFSGLLDLKLGRVTVGEDFASAACDFQNLTFCGSLPGNLAGDYWYNWPVSQWGTRFRVRIGTEGYFQLGLYQNNKSNLAKGFTFDFSGGNGALLTGGGAWTPHWGGLAASYKLGFWYDSASTADVLENNGETAQVPRGSAFLGDRGRYGVYVNLQQQITGDSKTKQGLSLFVNFTDADRLTSDFDIQFATGAAYTGLIPARPKDVLALAFGINHLNNHKQGELVLSGAPPSTLGPGGHNEYVVELDYQVSVLERLTLRPNLQRVFDAGGYAGKHATVVGLKAVAAL